MRAHGIPRPTYDVDFIIIVDQDDLPAVFSEIRSAGYDIPQEYETGWIDHVAEMPLVKACTFVEGRLIMVDLLLTETRFQQSLMDRRIRDRVNGLDAWLVTPEDLILLKLLAARPRDLGDVQDVLLMQLKLDEDYLWTWADALQVRERLEDALNSRQ